MTSMNDVYAFLIKWLEICMMQTEGFTLKSRRARTLKPAAVGGGDISKGSTSRLKLAYLWGYDA